MAYEQVAGPIGPERDDWNAASTVAAIFEVNRNTKKRQKPFTAKEFVPKWGSKKKQTPQQQMSIMQRVAAALTKKG